MKETVFLAEKFIKERGQDRAEHYPSVYHFMPPTGWINDPNGVCFYRGEYHLFYQYNPFDTVWDNPYWGHAVTEDFIRYKNLPVALAPDDARSYGCFSGGAIVANEKLILCYTRHFSAEDDCREEQFIAVSEDGVSFEEKRILGGEALSEKDSKRDFRDPNPVFIDGEYYLFIGSKDISSVGQILVYRSEDMSAFEYHMTIKHESFGSMLECPDMFRLNGKDVLVFSSLGYSESDSPNGGRYGAYALVGKIDFKNKRYSFESLTKLDYGTDFYAPQTLEAADGRRILFAWLDTWNKNDYIRKIQNRTSGRYALPRELYFEDGKLCVRPVSEIYRYFNQKINFEKGAVLQKSFFLKAEFYRNSRIFLYGEDGSMEVGRKNGKIYLKSEQKNYLQFERSLDCKEEKCTLLLFSDAGSFEVFTEGGSSFSAQVLLEGDTLAVGAAEDIFLLEARSIDKNAAQIAVE